MLKLPPPPPPQTPLDGNLMSADDMASIDVVGAQLEPANNCGQKPAPLGQSSRELLTGWPVCSLGRL